MFIHWLNFVSQPPWFTHLSKKVYAFAQVLVLCRVSEAAGSNSALKNAATRLQASNVYSHCELQLLLWLNLHYRSMRTTVWPPGRTRSIFFSKDSKSRSIFSSVPFNALMHIGSFLRVNVSQAASQQRAGLWISTWTWRTDWCSPLCSPPTVLTWSVYVCMCACIV